MTLEQFKLNVPCFGKSAAPKLYSV